MLQVDEVLQVDVLLRNAVDTDFNLESFRVSFYGFDKSSEVSGETEHLLENSWMGVTLSLSLMGYKFKFPTFDSFMRSIELHGSTSKCLITESEGLGKLIELYLPPLIDGDKRKYIFVYRRKCLLEF